VLVLVKLSMEGQKSLRIRFNQKYCVLKMNASLMNLELHEGE